MLTDFLAAQIPITAFTAAPIPDVARQMKDKLIADWEEFAQSAEASDPSRRAVVRHDFLRAIANIKLGMEMRYNGR